MTELKVRYAGLKTRETDYYHIKKMLGPSNYNTGRHEVISIMGY